MVEIVFINSFHNHDWLFYTIKKQKSIPLISIKARVFPNFNRKFNWRSPKILLYFFHRFSIIAEYMTDIIRYNSKYFSANKKNSQKKFIKVLPGADSCRANICAFLKCDKCINSGEPAAVCCLPPPIKVVELRPPETTAAGSLFGRVLKERSFVISHWSLVKEFRRQMKMRRRDIALLSFEHYYRLYAPGSRPLKTRRTPHVRS